MGNAVKSLGAVVRSTMSETQPTLFNQRVSGLLIAGALLLVAIYLARGTPPPPREPVNESISPSPDRVHLGNPKAFDVEAFKRTIIDNNLFRPLGWTPPRPIEPYRLLGTILPRSANTPPQAIIQMTAGNRTYILTPGEKIDADTEVVSIESKAVTLSTNGQQRTLHLPIGF